jgi:hypothetical protein
VLDNTENFSLNGIVYQAHTEYVKSMPKISGWGPISIFINTRGEHNPPHFHAVSAEWEASIRIADFGVLAGRLPPKLLGEVVEWAALHQNELMQEWDNMRAGRSLGTIGGLK